MRRENCHVECPGVEKPMDSKLDRDGSTQYIYITYAKQNTHTTTIWKSEWGRDPPHTHGNSD
jgi:hypothetical protein